MARLKKELKQVQQTCLSLMHIRDIFEQSRDTYWSDMGFNKTRQTWVVDLETKVLTSLSDNSFYDWDPVWAP